MTPPTTPFPLDLRRLLEPFKGEWVALSPDEKRVLGHGKSLDEALETAKQASPDERPVLFKVPSEGTGFVII